MKRHISNTNHGIHLENPHIVETKNSFKTQFIFYFLFLVLGVLAIYGCFYTAFSVPLSHKSTIFYVILFCAVFTFVFSMKLRYILMLFLSLAAVIPALLLRSSLILDNLINHIIQGFNITYNSVISAYNEKVHYKYITLPVNPAGINELTSFSTLFAVLVLFIITLMMAWLLIRRKSTISCLLLTVPFFGVSVVYNIIPHYLAVAALYVFWALLILNSSFFRNKSKFNKKKQEFYSGQRNINHQSLFFLPILVASLMLISVLFPMDSFQRSDFVKNLRISILNVPRVPSLIQIPIQSALGYNNRVDLQQVGNITFTGNTVLRVKSSNNEGDYLKGFVGSIYTGQSWDALPENEYEKLDLILNGLKVQNFTSRFNNILGRPATTYYLTIQNAKRNSLRVYAPYGLVSTPEELPGIDFINDGVLRSGNALMGTWEYSIKATNLQIDAWRMTISMREAFITEHSNFINAALDYNDFVYSHYTQLPEDLKKKLYEYRLEHNLNIVNYLSHNAFANAIISQVQSENSYTLSPGTTPADRDFVEYFLFENHKGYCVHFASATVALLRSAGVPARYVEGYAVSPSDFKDNNEWANIPDSRSHAWVEIYLSATGWVPIEATPGANRGIIDHVAAEFGTSSPNSSLDKEKMNDDEDIKELPNTRDLPGLEDDEFESDETQNSNTNPLIDAIIKISKVLGIPVLLATALFFNRKLQVSARHRQFSEQDTNKAAMAIYDYMVKLHKYANPYEKDSFSLPKDLYNIMLKVRFSQHMLTKLELEKLLIYAEKQAAITQATVTLFKRFIGKYVYVLF